MIRAARMEPGTNAVRIVEFDPGDLLPLQEAVGGYFESVTLPDAILLVDEHGKLKGSPVNWVASQLAMPVIGDIIVGTALLFGPPRRSELTSVTPDWLRRIEQAGGVVR